MGENCPSQLSLTFVCGVGSTLLGEGGLLRSETLGTLLYSGRGKWRDNAGKNGGKIFLVVRGGWGQWEADELVAVGEGGGRSDG